MSRADATVILDRKVVESATVTPHTVYQCSPAAQLASNRWWRRASGDGMLRVADGWLRATEPSGSTKTVGCWLQEADWRKGNADTLAAQLDGTLYMIDER